VYVYICFDVEDLVHPDSDDIARDIGEMLADEGVVASMYVVGEKARLWEERGRIDVIAAVGQHDVGFHTNRHSIHPTVSEYLADKDWPAGVAEAIRQEGPGVQDLARIFGIYPSTWGTPGSSWGPQIPAATRQLGIPANTYSHARSGETGACWFAGQLCYADFLYFPGGEDSYTTDATFEASLSTLLQQLTDAHKQGFSCMGIFAAHPTRLRYTIFWDQLNFARGQNTAPSDYRFSPRRSDEEYGTSLRNLRRMILAVRDLPGVELISTRALNNHFALENGPIAWSNIRQLAQATVDNHAIGAENPLASSAQTLDLLARALIRLVDGPPPPYLLLRRVLGPLDSPPALAKSMRVNEDVALALCHQLTDYISQTGHLPISLAVNNVPVGPGALLRGLARTYLELDSGQRHDGITLQPGPEEPAIAARLAEENIYQQLPGWPPHSPDLKLDQLALHTRLQSWSLKPAVLVNSV
jgi:hypothetical protein